MPINYRKLIPLVQLIVSIFISLFLKLVLALTDLAYITLVIGILLTIAVFQITSVFTEEFEQASDIYRMLRSIGHVDLNRRGQIIIEECKAKLKDLMEGRVRLTDENVFFEVIELSRKFSKTLHAVTLSDVTKWGIDERCETYLKEQRRAIKERGAQVTRVFILTDEETQDKKIRDAIDRQHEMGITIRIARRETLPSRLIEDYAIFDSDVVVWAAFSSESVVTETLTKNRGDVLEYEKRFKNIITRSLNPEDIWHND